MRQQQQLEQLKQRIAESARKAGLDAEFETLEKNIKVLPHLRSTGCYPVLPYVIIQREAPPEAEWWDQSLLPGDDYGDLERNIQYLHLRRDSVIDQLIQHPIPIPPPGDKNKVAPKPLMLTKKVTITVTSSIVEI